jgi:hypothetical protein
MKRKIILTRSCSKTVDDLLKKRQLTQEDFEDFLQQLAEHPDEGDLVPGTGGLRKTRLKSASGGKRGGFRVCYYFFKVHDEIYLIQVYAKNVQEDLTMQEKKDIKRLISVIRGTNE